MLVPGTRLDWIQIIETKVMTDKRNWFLWVFQWWIPGFHGKSWRTGKWVLCTSAEYNNLDLNRAKATLSSLLKLAKESK